MKRWGAQEDRTSEKILNDFSKPVEIYMSVTYGNISPVAFSVNDMGQVIGCFLIFRQF